MRGGAFITSPRLARPARAAPGTAGSSRLPRARTRRRHSRSAARAQPYETATQPRFALGNAAGAWPLRHGPGTEDGGAAGAEGAQRLLQPRHHRQVPRVLDPSSGPVVRRRGPSHGPWSHLCTILHTHIVTVDGKYPGLCARWWLNGPRLCEPEDEPFVARRLHGLLRPHGRDEVPAIT